MARKSKKVDFVNVGKAVTVTAAKEEKPIFRAGLYARLSLESDANKERGTIENQIGLLKKFVEGADDIVVEREYMDVSKTGTNFERAGFEEMMRDIRDGRINCVIVKDDCVIKARTPQTLENRHFLRIGTEFRAIQRPQRAAYHIETS